MAEKNERDTSTLASNSNANTNGIVPQSTQGATEKTPLIPDPKQSKQTGAGNEAVSDSESDRDPLLWRRTVTKPLKWYRVLKFMLPYAIPDTLRLKMVSLAVLTLTMLLRALALVPPYSLKLAVDQVASKNPEPPFFAILLYFAAVMLQAVLTSANSVLKVILNSGVKQRFGVNAFRHLVHLDFAYHTKQKSGNRFSIIWRGAYAVRILMTEVLFKALPTLFECTLVVIVFFHLGTPLISLLVFFSVIVYWVVSKLRTDVTVDQERRSNKIRDELKAKEVDTLINIETVKLFGTEEREISAYDDLRTEIRVMDTEFEIVGEGFSLGTTAVQRSAASAALALAAVGASNGSLTAGDFVLINSYIGQLFAPLLSLSSTYQSIMRATASVETVIKMFDTEPTIVDLPKPIEASISEYELAHGLKGTLSFEEVYFKYKTKGRKNEAVRDVSFTVPAGKVLGVVGHSGSGKTTLVKLATRLFDVDFGAVKIDGVDIRKYSIKSFRRLFGIVSQETSLFNSNIRENIAYGNPDAIDEELWEALSASALDEFVRKLPQGLETKVGERGIKLSGGEKQRLGVARCMLLKPPIVILDEASSSLDSRTEKSMQSNMKALCRGRTTLIVAHRLSTIMNADEIIVMDAGTIVESGTHKELLDLGGQYYDMWNTQIGMDNDPSNDV